jgi:tetrapyrrole methylase family protein/MazG family protein/ATP diphosphatase
MDELLAIMARLRDPAGGCPWDLEQTTASIAPYTLEEAYEVVDAIERSDVAALKEELGDLLLQVVFHARIAEERGEFDFAAVAQGIAAKLVRRHPHVFGDERLDGAAAQSRRWEELKAAEKAAAGRGASVLDDVPLALPALARAAKLGRRAARIGFDWPDAGGARAKVDEELAELDAARAGGAQARIAAELGDVLLAVTNLARHLAVDPEAALRAANARFASRFAHVERRARASGATDAATLESYWQEAKSAEPKGG